MAKQVYYSATDLASVAKTKDPYLRPSFPLWQRAKRGMWDVCWILLFRPSLRTMFGWRTFLLRTFGARLGANCKFYPGTKVWAPWNLICGDAVRVADGAEIYNPAPITFGSHAIVSQGAYVCGATHDFDDPDFPLLAYTMSVGAYAWICARAAVGPGINIAEGAVLGLASIASKDLEAWTVYAGSPAVKIKTRRRIKQPEPLLPAKL